MEGKEDKNLKPEVEEKKEEKIVVPEFFESISLLPMVSAAENQNGLRHKDYKRYQNYCSRKIHKLRKVLRLTQGKNREFIKKEITPEIATNSKILFIKIFEVERYWAQAMHLKQKITQSITCLLYTSPSPRDLSTSRMPSSA
eukprot:TRINITY_DN2074_c0_g1_i2.p1 TRINITY_DN2074_c0_g1~~TRINITY_DN2074_c0_g1_i2.p1  ORF type:complete len:142 (+),score=62.80 TRINITY_DN2074_c0_g1_i2:118-543(+)